MTGKRIGYKRVNIKYPKNIYDFFSDGRDKEFSKWAFGCEQPGSNQKALEYWEKYHPEYLMKSSDIMYLCICKMNYIYQKEKNDRKKNRLQTSQHE